MLDKGECKLQKLSRSAVDLRCASQFAETRPVLTSSNRRRHPLHVDYVFLGACLGYIQDAMFEAILSHPRLNLERKIAIVKAVGKVIWIQVSLPKDRHLQRQLADRASRRTIYWRNGIPLMGRSTSRTAQSHSPAQKKKAICTARKYWATTCLRGALAQPAPERAAWEEISRTPTPRANYQCAVPSAVSALIPPSMRSGLPRPPNRRLDGV